MSLFLWYFIGAIQSKNYGQKRGVWKKIKRWGKPYSGGCPQKGGGGAEKKRNFELLSKGNALKRKSQEKQDEASKLEEALQYSKRKEEKLLNGQLKENI